MQSDISYLAGILDGEGYFGLRQGKSYVVCMQVANNSLELMDWLYNNFGGWYTAHLNDREHHEVTHVWTISSKKELIDILPFIIPELIVKKVQAQLLLEFCMKFNIGKGLNYTEAQRQEMKPYSDIMKVLNSKGAGSNRNKDLIKKYLGEIL